MCRHWEGEVSIWCISTHILRVEHPSYILSALCWASIIYVLSIHHIFSQHSPSFWGIGGRISSGLRALAIHLTKVSLGKAFVRLSAILRLVGTWISEVSFWRPACYSPLGRTKLLTHPSMTITCGSWTKMEEEGKKMPCLQVILEPFDLQVDWFLSFLGSCCLYISQFLADSLQIF